MILNPLDRKYLEADIDAPKRKAIVCAARIVYVKDHMTLLRAYERVIKKHPDYVLELYGGRGEDHVTILKRDCPVRQYLYWHQSLRECLIP